MMFTQSVVGMQLQIPVGKLQDLLSKPGSFSPEAGNVLAPGRVSESNLTRNTVPGSVSGGRGRGESLGYGGGG